MVRPVPAVLLLAAIPVVLIASLVHGRRMLASVIATTLFTAGIALPIAPLMLRNVTLYGSWHLMSQTGELAFWFVPLVTERAYGVPFQQTLDRLRAEYAARAAASSLNENSNPFRLDDLKIELAREAMAKLPLKASFAVWLEGMVVNLASPAIILDPRVRELPKPSFYNTPGQTLSGKARNYIFDNPGLYQSLLVLGLLSMLPFLILQAVGLVLLYRIYPWAAVCALGILVYFLIINGPVANSKYRLPMEPVLIILTAIAAVQLLWRPLENWMLGSAETIASGQSINQTQQRQVCL